jgi:3-oxosteroid 1-dehydrogenase
MTTWDQENDVLIIGSGAGAMTAALRAQTHGLDALVCEKSEFYGGSSAMSGGAVWVPNHHLMGKAGLQDSKAEAFQYLKSILNGKTSDEKINCYLESAPAMVQWLVENTAMRFTPLSQYPDYYPEEEGGKAGGRSLEPDPFSGRQLGDDFALLRPSHPQEMVLGKIAITAAEAHSLVGGNMWIAMRRLLAYQLDIPARMRSRRDNRLTLGNALIGRLRKSMIDRDIPIWLNSPLKELIVENGHVVGALIVREGQEVRIRAKRGVILAAGGFARNKAMRDKFQRAPTSDTWTSANPHNTGEVICMGQELGAALDLMDDAWWTPVTLVPGKKFSWILVVEKSMPGAILVNQAGNRFTNEGAPYINVVNGIYESHDTGVPTVPSYLVFDARYRKHYPCGPLPPAKWQPDNRLPKKFRNDFMNRASSMAELAEKIDVDVEGLGKTIARFNEFAKTGKDLDFQRGDSLYDRYYSDAKITPNPCLAPIAEPPFYAIAVYPGDLGTKGGLRTNIHGQVLKETNEPIEGLFAIGNCSASIMGNTYPGAGGTIGPAMTFGFRAADFLSQTLR